MENPRGVCFVNVEAVEAVDEVQQLQAEIDRLRAALSDAREMLHDDRLRAGDRLVNADTVIQIALGDDARSHMSSD